MQMEKFLAKYGFTSDKFHDADNKLITAMFVEMVKWVSALEDKIKAQDARIRCLESTDRTTPNY